MMEVILIQDADNLGAANEVVKVRNGYARNFLIPRGVAVEASPSNLKQLEERKKQLAKKSVSSCQSVSQPKLKTEYVLLCDSFLKITKWSRISCFEKLKSLNPGSI